MAKVRQTARGNNSRGRKTPFALTGVDLAATTDTTLILTGTRQEDATINFCNRTAGTATIRLGLSATSSFAAATYIAYEMTLPANDRLEFLDIAIPPETYVLVRSSISSVNVMVY